MRQLQWCGVILGAALMGVLALQSAAGGATVTAGEASAHPTSMSPGPSTQSGPSRKFGSSFKVTMCGFAPEAASSLAVDGRAVSFTPAVGNGCATFAVVMTDSRLSLNGGPAVAVHDGPGSIDITGTGTSPGGGTRTDTYTLPVDQEAAPASSGVTFAGTDVLAVMSATLALFALGFLLFVFSRRRISPA